MLTLIFRTYHTIHLKRNKNSESQVIYQEWSKWGRGKGPIFTPLK